MFYRALKSSLCLPVWPHWPLIHYAVATIFFSDLNILTFLLLYCYFRYLQHTVLNSFVWLKFLPTKVLASVYPSQFRPFLTSTLISQPLFTTHEPLSHHHLLYFLECFSMLMYQGHLFLLCLQLPPLIESKDHGRRIHVFYFYYNIFIT